MPNKNYVNGRTREYRTMRLLETLGYTAFRSAGSHGLWDVIGYNSTSMVFIQVKFNKGPSESEWEMMREAIVPPHGYKIVHIYKKGTHAPTVLRVE